MTVNTQTQQVRNVGSSFTHFLYDGQAIAYAEVLRDTGVQPVATHEFIQPIGSEHPIDIVTPRAVGGGSLTVTIRELWHQEVWEQLRGLTGAKSIIEIFERLARTDRYVTCAKIIRPPSGRQYGKTYHRCVVTAIQDAEEVRISTLSVPKTVTISYTHSTPI